MDTTDRGILTTAIIIGIIIIILLIARPISGTRTGYNYTYSNGLAASALPFEDTRQVATGGMVGTYTVTRSRTPVQQTVTPGTSTTTTYTTYEQSYDSYYYGDGCTTVHVSDGSLQTVCY